MKKTCFLLVLSIILLVFLSACMVSYLISPTETPVPTEAPQPTKTPLPTATFTITPTLTRMPTNTPLPTKTSTVAAELSFGELQTVVEGGYSFRAPVGYDVNIDGSIFSISDKDRTFFISVLGNELNGEYITADDVVDKFLSALFEKAAGEYTTSNPEIIMIDGNEGILYAISGTMVNKPMSGQAVAMINDAQQFLFGMGFAYMENDKTQWGEKESEVFLEVIDSITFGTTDISQSTGGCIISTDETYGYTEENPIRVGGDAFDGPPRERAYLDNLLGPNGEVITYVRTGSLPFEDTILDIFEISIHEQIITLYIDEYSFTEPQASVGFTCVSAFPLTTP